MKDLKAKEKTWWIAHNNKDIFHYGIVERGNEVTTGQPELETFTDETSWRARATALGFEIKDQPDKPVPGVLPKPTPVVIKPVGPVIIGKH